MMELGGDFFQVIQKPHIAKLLNILRENGASSKVEISKAMNLTFPTITTLLNTLIDKGIVIESGKGVSKGGRRPILYRLNSESVYVIGIDITVHEIRLGLFNLEAELVRHHLLLSPVHKTPEAFAETVYKGVHLLVEAEKVKKDHVIGIGVSSPGPVNPKQGKVFSPPNLPLWKEVSLQSLLENKLRIPVKIEKDANVAALGEMWFGIGKDVSHLVYILISEGIGGGVIINRSLIDNDRFGVGEIGHGTVDMNGPLCNCGNYGCLEVMASGMAILKEYRRKLQRNSTELHQASADITYAMLLTALEKQEKIACRTVDESSKILGVGIINVINFFNPELIIIGGKIPKIYPKMIEIVNEMANQRVIDAFKSNLAIVPGKLQDNVNIMGAAALILEEVFNRH